MHSAPVKVGQLEDEVRAALKKVVSVGMDYISEPGCKQLPDWGVLTLSQRIICHIHLFIIHLKMFLGDFSLKLFLNCSYFLIFPSSELVAQNNKKALRNECLLLFHLVVCEKRPRNTKLSNCRPART